MILLVGLFGPMLVLASAQMVPLAILLALVSAAMLLKDGPTALRIHWPLLILTTTTVLYIACADLWTPLGENLERAVRAGSLVLCGALAWVGLNRLDEKAKAHSSIALLIGIVFVLIWLAIEKVSGNWLLRQLSDKPNLDWWYGAYNRALNVLAIVGPIIAALFWNRSRVLAIAAGLAPLLAGLVMGASNSAILAAGAGLGIAILAAWQARTALVLMTVSIFAAALFAPIVLRDSSRIAPTITYSVESENFSFQHRMITWHFTSARIAERPILGWGARAARNLPDAEMDIYTYSDRIDADWPPLIVTDEIHAADVMPLHPHNALLQARLELGLIGTLLLLGTLTLGLSRAILSPGRVRNFALLGSVAAAATIWCLSVGLWQSWWIAALGIAFALTRLVPEENN